MLKKPYLSMYAQMLYVLLVGLLLMTVPNWVLGIVGLPPIQDPWLRVLGLLVFILGNYYFYIARYGNEKIVWATILGRWMYCGGMGIFAVVGIIKPLTLLFVLAELTLSVWSLIEIKTPQKQ